MELIKKSIKNKIKKTKKTKKTKSHGKRERKRVRSSKIIERNKRNKRTKKNKRTKRNKRNKRNKRTKKNYGKINKIMKGGVNRLIPSKILTRENDAPQTIVLECDLIIGISNRRGQTLPKGSPGIINCNRVEITCSNCSYSPPFVSPVTDIKGEMIFCDVTIRFYARPPKSDIGRALGREYLEIRRGWILDRSKNWFQKKDKHLYPVFDNNCQGNTEVDKHVKKTLKHIKKAFETDVTRRNLLENEQHGMMISNALLITDKIKQSESGTQNEGFLDANMGKNLCTATVFCLHTLFRGDDMLSVKRATDFLTTLYHNRHYCDLFYENMMVGEHYLADDAVEKGDGILVKASVDWGEYFSQGSMREKMVVDWFATTMEKITDYDNLEDAILGTTDAIWEGGNSGIEKTREIIQTNQSNSILQRLPPPAGSQESSIFNDPLLRDLSSESPGKSLAKGSFGVVYSNKEWEITIGGRKRRALIKLNRNELPNRAPGYRGVDIELFKEKVKENFEETVKEIQNGQIILRIINQMDRDNLQDFFTISYAMFMYKGIYPCLVQEYGGDALDKKLYDEEWEPTIGNIFQILHDIATGLDIMHSGSKLVDSKGCPAEIMIHRDLKSPNILIREEGENFRAIITDFGLSRTMEFWEGCHDAMMTGCGSIHFMAPEIFKGEKYDQSVDIFSFAMVGYELVCRKWPWEGFCDDREIPWECSNGRRPTDQLDGGISELKKLSGMTTSAENKADSLKSLICECWENKRERRPTAETIMGKIKITDEKGELVLSAPGAPAGIPGASAVGIPGGMPPPEEPQEEGVKITIGEYRDFLNQTGNMCEYKPTDTPNTGLSKMDTFIAEVVNKLVEAKCYGWAGGESTQPGIELGGESTQPGIELGGESTQPEISAREIEEKKPGYYLVKKDTFMYFGFWLPKKIWLRGNQLGEWIPGSSDPTIDPFECIDRFYETIFKDKFTAPAVLDGAGPVQFPVKGVIYENSNFTKLRQIKGALVQLTPQQSNYTDVLLEELIDYAKHIVQRLRESRLLVPEHRLELGRDSDSHDLCIFVSKSAEGPMKIPLNRMYSRIFEKFTKLPNYPGIQMLKRGTLLKVNNEPSSVRVESGEINYYGYAKVSYGSDPIRRVRNGPPGCRDDDDPCYLQGWVKLGSNSFEGDDCCDKIEDFTHVAEVGDPVAERDPVAEGPL